MMSLTWNANALDKAHSRRVLIMGIFHGLF